MKSINTNKDGLKVAYSYRRYSSRNQENGSSLGRQLDDARAVCVDKGWRLIDLPPDKGVSAYKITDADEQEAANFHKGNLGKFINKARAGEIDKGSVLVIERLDRFSRNYFDIVFPVWLELLQSGIEIYSCVSRQHYTLEAIRKNAMLASMALMEMAMANDYSANLSNRIGKAFKIRYAECSKGLKMNLGSWTPAWIDFNGKKGQEGTFKINDKGLIVKSIIAQYIAGKSMSKIAQELNDKNTPTISGKGKGVWKQGHVHHILETETLIGDTTVKGQTFKGYYPAVCDQETYKKLQAKLLENKNRKGGNAKGVTIANLFRNRCKCSVCGGTVSSHICGDNYQYYCLNHRYRKCNVKQTLLINLVEQDFFGLFLQESPVELLGKQTTQHSSKVSGLKTSISELDKTIAEVSEFIGKLPMAEVSKKLTALETNRQTLKTELDEVNRTMLQSNNAPMVFNTIKHALAESNATKWGTTKGNKADYNLSMAFNTMIDQLQNQDTRKQLLGLLPGIVNHLEMDLPNGQYRIVHHNGDMSEWREVVL